MEDHLSNLYGVFHREFGLNWSYQVIGYKYCMLFVMAMVEYADILCSFSQILSMLQLIFTPVKAIWLIAVSFSVSCMK